MLRYIPISVLFPLYSNKDVDGYALICAVEDIAKLLRCSQSEVINGALSNAQAAKVIHRLALSHM